jgi:thiosulfate/3-mercaptopyruvate sulfurtransferase
MRRRDLLLGSAMLPFAARGVAHAQATPAVADQWSHPEWFANPDWIVAQAENPDLRIIALTPVEEFMAGHIPGAGQIDWPDLELVDSAEATVEDWRADVEGKLTALGIMPASTIVVYDGGTFYAPRLSWVLDQLGHTDKRVLDGGLPAWIESGGDIEQGSTWVGYPPADPYIGAPNEDALARIDEVVMVSDNDWGSLVDARTLEEFRKGRIPGAVNIPFTDNALPDSGGRWRSPADLRAMYAAKGVRQDQLIIPYCTTGVRSANTYFTLRALGYPNVKLFSGSYAEWTSDPFRPIEAGAAP